MFETSYVLKLSPFAKNAKFRQEDYPQCWKDLKPAEKHQPLLRQLASKL